MNFGSELIYLGKTCLWKKYILLYECRLNQGEKNFWNRTLSFWASTKLAPANWPVRLNLMVHVSKASKGQCRNLEISPPLLLAIKVDQNIVFPQTCFAYTILNLEFMVWWRQLPVLTRGLKSKRTFSKTGEKYSNFDAFATSETSTEPCQFQILP